MQNPKVGDRCKIPGDAGVYTINCCRRYQTADMFLLIGDKGHRWLAKEYFEVIPSPPKSLTWIKINKPKLTTPEIHEELGVLKNLIYSAHENTISYELIQEDGSWKHFTIILPDSAEVVIGRKAVDIEQA